jgi:hypothetical protein
MVGKQMRMALLSRYEKLHKERYGVKPDHNLYREQWAADMLVESYTLPGCYDLLDYYFEAATSPTWKYFVNYAEEILKSKQRVEQDRSERAERRKLAKEWLNG